MAVQTGQRTTQNIASSQKTTKDAEFEKRSRAAKKAARTRAKNETKSSSKSKSKTTLSFEIANNPFFPGEKVQVHNPLDVEVQLREGREPQVKPVATASVTKEGDLSFSGLDKGNTYVAYGEDSERSLTFLAK